jgi:hypothetical protein
MTDHQFDRPRKNPIITAIMVLLVILVFLLAQPFLIPGYIKGIFLRFKFRRATLQQGKFVLFVYSDSPKWKPYIEQNILPQIQEHAVVLNWSERNQWDKRSWAVQAFQHWGGQKDFNPMALVYCNLASVQVIRFYKAFHEYKHGRTIKLQKAEGQLLQLVEAKTGKSI